MPSVIEELPSVVVPEILKYLSWNEKLAALQAIWTWKPHLQTPSSWPLVRYCHEEEVNKYFVRERRANFLRCIKVFGKYMRHIDIAFGHILGRSGLHILRAIAENCSVLHLFRFTPYQAVSPDNFEIASLQKSDIAAVCSILSKCQQLSDVGILSLNINWTDCADTNLVIELCRTHLASKVTRLEFVPDSLKDHDGYMTQLEEFSNLKKLIVRREKINDRILLKLISNGLQEVTFNQDEELARIDSEQLGAKFWDKALSINSQFKVNLILQFILVIRDSFVPNMPLHNLVLDDLVNIVTKGVVDHLVTCYQNSLESFTYTNQYLENYESGDSRLPGALVSMVTQCQKLHTLKYGFPLSSTTILLIAKARKLKELLIPVVEVSYDFDWPVQSGWTEEFVQWLKENSKSEKNLERAISHLLGFEWKLLHEKLSYENKHDACLCYQSHSDHKM